MIGEAVGPPSDDHASGGEPAGAAPLPGAAMLSSATAAAPTVTRGRRRHRRMGPVLVGLLVPALMILLGVSLMASSLAGGSDSSSDPVTRPRNPARPASTDTNSGSDDTTSRSTDDTAVDAATTTDAVVVTAAVPVIAVPIVGDPADRAAMIAQTFLTALANEDFRTARAMTDTDVDEQAEQNLDAATLIPVSASQIGPDRVAMRLVIVEYRTVENELTTTFICAQWDVATATGRIDQLGTAPLGDRRVGKVVPGDLGDTLAADCDATAINPSG